jgi:hypothetical protein
MKKTASIAICYAPTVSSSPYRLVTCQKSLEREKAVLPRIDPCRRRRSVRKSYAPPHFASLIELSNWQNSQIVG